MNNNRRFFICDIIQFIVFIFGFCCFEVIDDVSLIELEEEDPSSEMSSLKGLPANGQANIVDVKPINKTVENKQNEIKIESRKSDEVKQNRADEIPVPTWSFELL
jgi:hypothetical protein